MSILLTTTYRRPGFAKLQRKPAISPTKVQRTHASEKLPEVALKGKKLSLVNRQSLSEYAFWELGGTLKISVIPSGARRGLEAQFLQYFAQCETYFRGLLRGQKSKRGEAAPMNLDALGTRCSTFLDVGSAPDMLFRRQLMAALGLCNIFNSLWLVETKQTGVELLLRRHVIARLQMEHVIKWATSETPYAKPADAEKKYDELLRALAGLYNQRFEGALTGNDLKAFLR